MKGQKLIIGARHVDEKELNDINALILQRQPSKVGLELPEDHLQREEHKIGAYFFSDINSYSANLGIKVLYLESPAAWDSHQVIDMAKAVREGRLKESGIQKEMGRINNDLANSSAYTAPERLYQQIFFRERYKKVLGVLADIPALEEITRLWDALNAERESHVLHRICKEKPDIVVIGDAHARKLKGSLPEYQYLRLYL